jgi:hypothetical protein
MLKKSSANPTLHYAWIVGGVTFLVSCISSGPLKNSTRIPNAVESSPFRRQSQVAVSVRVLPFVFGLRTIVVQSVSRHSLGPKPPSQLDEFT